ERVLFGQLMGLVGAVRGGRGDAGPAGDAAILGPLLVRQRMALAALGDLRMLVPPLGGIPPALDQVGQLHHRNAFSPVRALPTTSVCTSCVPSYVSTDSRLFMWRITGYSSVIPLAPRIVRAVRAASIAPRTLPIFPMLTWWGCSVPASFIRPRCSATSVPRFT